MLRRETSFGGTDFPKSWVITVSRVMALASHPTRAKTKLKHFRFVWGYTAYMRQQSYKSCYKIWSLKDKIANFLCVFRHELLSHNTEFDGGNIQERTAERSWGSERMSFCCSICSESLPVINERFLIYILARHFLLSAGFGDKQERCYLQGAGTSPQTRTGQNFRDCKHHRTFPISVHSFFLMYLFIADIACVAVIF